VASYGAMTRGQTPSATVESGFAQDPSASPPRPVSVSPWWLWLGWAWVGILVLAAVAELFDVQALRLALDFRRHVR
jgi:hypothetical protein